MDTSIVSGLAAVLGSLVGGSATFATALITQRTQTRRELIRMEIRKRETLYGEFIGECAKLFMDSLDHTLDKPETLLRAHELLNRIRFSATGKVLKEAEHLLGQIMEQYFSPNLSMQDMRELAQAGSDADPLKSFGEACRAELQSLQGTV